MKEFSQFKAVSARRQRPPPRIPYSCQRKRFTLARARSTSSSPRPLITALSNEHPEAGGLFDGDCWRHSAPAAKAAVSSCRTGTDLILSRGRIESVDSLHSCCDKSIDQQICHAFHSQGFASFLPARGIMLQALYSSPALPLSSSGSY